MKKAILNFFRKPCTWHSVVKWNHKIVFFHYIKNSNKTKILIFAKDQVLIFAMCPNFFSGILSERGGSKRYPRRAMY